MVGESCGFGNGRCREGVCVCLVSFVQCRLDLGLGKVNKIVLNDMVLDDRLRRYSFLSFAII